MARRMVLGLYVAGEAVVCEAALRRQRSEKRLFMAGLIHCRRGESMGICDLVCRWRQGPLRGYTAGIEVQGVDSNRNLMLGVFDAERTEFLAGGREFVYLLSSAVNLARIWLLWVSYEFQCLIIFRPQPSIVPAFST